MDKTIIGHKTEIQSLSECFLKLADAVKRGEISGEEAVKVLLEYADHKTEPRTEETEMERLERIDNELEDAWARIRELTDEPQTERSE